ncbi:MAG TPA: acyl-CoA dehydrogenase family protein [Kofleriaceae bacterium]|nr:acyl-CoA dehydrogenase family protein [Kofleriaceae bacterium]
MSQPLSHDDVLKHADRIATEIVAPAAARIDKSGEFPAAAIAALGEAGLLGFLEMRTAAALVERLARECGSTAMIVCMHHCAAAVIAQHGPAAVKQEIAAGRHLSTLAFSELGSRGQFWAPVGTATRAGAQVRLDAKKSFVTAAHAAHSYVWSSKPLSGAEVSTLWLVARGTAGVKPGDGFDGLGLRGNDSSPVTADGALVDERAILGADGAGFGIMMGTVLPWFNVLASSVSVGLMETATARTAAHAGAARFEHAGSTVADLPTVRAFVARMRIKTDCARALLDDTLAAIGAGRADATLRVLESKAATGELAAEVADLAMRVCGGAAFRKDVGVERVFRDARASLVMAPTTDVLYDFIGKAVCGLPLF